MSHKANDIWLETLRENVCECAVDYIQFKQYAQCNPTTFKERKRAWNNLVNAVEEYQICVQEL